MTHERETSGRCVCRNHSSDFLSSIRSNHIVLRHWRRICRPLSELEKRQGVRREGDGSTDDAAAIGKALKALKNTNAKTWNVLYFPAGTYMIGQPVYYTDRVNDDYTGLRIVGEDPATTLIKCMDTFPAATGGVAQGAMVRLDGTYGTSAVSPLMATIELRSDCCATACTAPIGGSPICSSETSLREFNMGAAATRDKI